MGIKEFFTDTFASTVTKTISGLADAADKFIQTGDEKATFQIELKKMELEFQKLQMQGENEYNKDRQSAREMYMQDSSLQKAFALVFLIAYCLLSAGMLAMVLAIAFFGKTVDLPDWGVMLISTVFGGMSSKVGTITDFLFGGSKKDTDYSAQTIEAFKKSSSPE